MKESLHQSIKVRTFFEEIDFKSVQKVKVLQNKIDLLVQRKRTKEAIVKCKKLFHLCTSFVS
jgi:hypothetical protein